MTKEQLLQREIYDILREPEHQKQFIRMMAEMIAKYVMLARAAQMGEVEE